MHIRLIAVGDRQPSWVDAAFEIYSGRLPREWRFRLERVPLARRAKNDKSDKPKRLEGEQVLGRVAAHEQVVLLDERGKQLASTELAARLADWQADGRDLCFLIGGPDGAAEACHARANFVWSLSRLTLPHGLARVLFAEQLYRAWSLQTGHPYHRD